MKREDNYRGGRDRSASPNGRMNSRYLFTSFVCYTVANVSTAALPRVAMSVLKVTAATIQLVILAPTSSSLVFILVSLKQKSPGSLRNMVKSSAARL